jgi:AraC family transcriptional regulator
MDPSSDQLLKNEYFLRLNRVIDYIQNHYIEDLNLATLASIACFSKFHFHRLFHAIVGETLNDFIGRIRLEKSVHKLNTDLNKSITDIAMQSGFSSSQQFSKAFKAAFGITPSHFRKDFNWKDWQNTMRSAGNKELQEFETTTDFLHSRYFIQQNLSLKNIINPEKELQVNIVEMQPFRVAYVRKIGPYSNETLLPSYEKLFQWANPKGLIEAGMMILGAMRSKPFTTPEDKMIFDACITLPESIKRDKSVNIQTLPGGKYAIYRCEIEYNTSARAWMNFILNWLIHSEYLPDERPLYQFHYNNAHEHPLMHEIHDLCMPIKPLYG